jgi:hypothetical protein
MMKPEDHIREQLKHHEASLDGWREPDGFLLPTEPDPEERQLMRERLKAAIYTLRWVLGEKI